MTTFDSSIAPGHFSIDFNASHGTTILRGVSGAGCFFDRRLVLQLREKGVVKMKKWTALFIFVSFIVSGLYFVQPSFAQRERDSYDRPSRERQGHACQHEVRKEIDKAHRVVQHGIHTKQIDQREAASIRNNIKRIENDLNRFVSDGRLTPRECERLQNELRGLHRHIKHDMND
jgi:hypothetical protein